MKVDRAATSMYVAPKAVNLLVVPMLAISSGLLEIRYVVPVRSHAEAAKVAGAVAGALASLTVDAPPFRDDQEMLEYLFADAPDIRNHRE